MSTEITGSAGSLPKAGSMQAPLRARLAAPVSRGSPRGLNRGFPAAGNGGAS
jgi:hypothetical protein